MSSAIPPSRPDFARRVIAWQRRHGRHDLPWQNIRDPYPIWISEVMLQQTQVATVVPYFRRFMARFPDIAALAAAHPDEVLAHWSGLGYYSRGRNLHQAARLVAERHGGRFPRDFAEILALPGIGRSTAAAIGVFAFGQRRAILDGNVKRVLTRCLGAAPAAGKAAETRLWEWAEALLPRREVERYTQGLMDLGATVCTPRNPRCPQCPLRAGCPAAGQAMAAAAPRRRILPRRSTVMLALLREGTVLLEKRPAAGLWGGLWSLPELPRDEPDILAYCQTRLGCEAEPLQSLPTVRHAFTHFKLDIQPRVLRVGPPRTAAQEPGWVWLPLAETAQAPLPAPVRRILQTIGATSLAPHPA